MTSPHKSWALSFAVTFCACQPSSAPVEKAPVEPIYLDQGWSTETRNEFRATGQGSLILSYDWFRVLEQADSTDLFRSDENLERFRFIPANPSGSNPDGMPVGFVKSFNADTNSQWIGLNCAGCHTAQIDYEGNSILVDGAPTMGDFQTFIGELEAALKATEQDPEKFERFTKNVLGEAFSDESSEELRASFSEVTRQRSYNNQINSTQTEYGYGRLDAFGITFNNVAVQFLGIPENQVDPNAPASYPFIWGALHSDYMQWIGSAPNTPVIGSILRATGEVWGTFGHLKMTPDANNPGYASSVPFEDISKLLGWVKELRSPPWPDIFPEIDATQVTAGRTHYETHCTKCHQVMSRDQQSESYKAVVTPYQEVGTDPTEVELVTTNESKTGALEGTPIAVLFGAKLGATTKTATLLFNASLGAMLRHSEESMREALRSHMGAYVQARQDIQAYKARPLTGIWATAPYLHNGSVANLNQLLLPPEQRDKVFYVGNREFDPKNIGFVSSQSEGSFKLDTRLVGNRNIGHNYGAELTDKQRWELVEYLKTL